MKYLIRPGDPLVSQDYQATSWASVELTVKNSLPRREDEFDKTWKVSA
jgi:hypothetical protein